MLFKKLKDASKEDLQSANPGVFASILELGKQASKEEFATQLGQLEGLNGQIDSLNQQLIAVKDENKMLVALNVKHENETKIRSFASKFGLHAEAEQLISEGKSIEDSLIILSEKSSAKNELKILGDVFEQTAPQTAGNPKQGELEIDEIKSFDQAVDYVRKRDNLSKAQATKVARREFSTVWQMSYGKRDSDNINSNVKES